MNFAWSAASGGLILFGLFACGSVVGWWASKWWAKRRRKPMRSAHHEQLLMMGQLSAGLVHEVNNPLSAISGYCHQIEEEMKDPSPESTKVIAHSATRIRYNIDRISKIIRSFKNFSRKTNDDFGPVSLTDVFEESVELISFEVKSSGVNLVTKIPEHDALVWGDRTQLSQIFVNLVLNARDAIKDHDDPEITMGFGVNAESGQLEAWVEDNGDGVAPDVAGKLFEPFFTTKDAGKGTGLGLAISRQIAQKHGGDLALDRRSYHSGARFVLTLPIYEIKEEQQSDAA